MPVYEFYCPDCHKIYQFFARTVHTEKIPDCPVCGRKKLRKRLSNFAFINTTAPYTEGLEQVSDETKLLDALMNLAQKSEELEHSKDSENQKMEQAISAFKGFLHQSGLKEDSRLEDSLLHSVRGKSLQEVEAELENCLDAEEYQLVIRQLKKYKHCFSEPERDDKLYDL